MLTLKWNKKTAVCILVAAAVLLALIVILAARGGEDSGTVSGSSLNSCEDRVAYLSQLGWTVDPASETEQDIVIPKTFSQVYEKYNELQKSQGFNLSEYCGLDAKIYSYTVTNHPSGEAATAQLILLSGQVIGGDIHSNALGGFMHGIKPTAD